MFRFHKTLDVLTLFHAPQSAGSKRVLELLKSASTRHTDDGSKKDVKPAFEIEVLEAPVVPTPDQFRSILEFSGANNPGLILKGSTSKHDAMKALEKGGPSISERLTRPLLVDWSNGRAVLGADENAVKSLLESLPK